MRVIYRNPLLIHEAYNIPDIPVLTGIRADISHIYNGAKDKKTIFNLVKKACERESIGKYIKNIEEGAKKINQNIQIEKYYNEVQDGISKKQYSESPRAFRRFN